MGHLRRLPPGSQGPPYPQLPETGHNRKNLPDRRRMRRGRGTPIYFKYPVFHQVEAAATIMLAPRFGPWRAIDKSKVFSQKQLGGMKTPNPCDQYRDRQHWFLVSGDFL
jgi:hypothetical protein